VVLITAAACAKLPSNHTSMLSGLSVTCGRSITVSSFLHQQKRTVIISLKYYWPHIIKQQRAVVFVILW